MAYCILSEKIGLIGVGSNFDRAIENARGRGYDRYIRSSDILPYYPDCPDPDGLFFLECPDCLLDVKNLRRLDIWVDMDYQRIILSDPIITA